MSNSIKCHSCGTVIDLSQALYDELKANFDKDLSKEVDRQTKALTSQIEQLTSTLSKSMSESGSAKAELTTLKLQLENIASQKESEYLLKLNEERKRVEREISLRLENSKKAFEESASLKVKEKEDTIRQLKEKLDEAQRKVEQGSMQQQGEAQEVLIEEYLAEAFPLDTIAEIKKGVMGADVLQVVNTRDASNIGTIYYESKRTKSFNNEWVDKFKQDMLAKGADAGILVSSARPQKFERASLIKGVWVCSLEEFKVLSQAVRLGLISVHESKSAQENKADKMVLIYNYLTSNEFRLQVEAIVDGFSQMQEDLNQEKRAMLSIWSKREKQINKVVESTIGMYGSIKGIGGNMIGDIKALELKGDL